MHSISVISINTVWIFILVNKNISHTEIAKLLLIVLSMFNIIINTTYVKGIDDVKHQKIFTIIKVLAIFIFLNMANLLLTINAA